MDYLDFLAKLVRFKVIAEIVMNMLSSNDDLHSFYLFGSYACVD